MNTANPFLRAPSLALCLLACACPSETSGTAGKDANKADKGKAADANKADKGKGKGKGITKKIADAKAADAKAAGAKAADGKAPDAKAPARKYRRGQLPPNGMSLEQLKRFATDVGDPTKGEFGLEQAFEGDPDLADKAKGTLTATFDTTMGSFDCELYEQKAPLTVANFVGLARGKRPTYDKKEDAWVTKNYYDGVLFHRVIKNFMIQTGDAQGTGRGNPGYVIADEFDKSLKHSGAGIMSMANRSKPNTGSTQFFITVRDTGHLDGKHAVFGKCEPAVAIEISKVKVDHRAGDRPYEQVKINSVKISRQAGGKTKKE